ncbi:MAG TPA: cytochrome c [Anaerolineae bacterium]
MRHPDITLTRLLQTLIILVMTLITYLGVRWWLGSEQSVHALPEFATRTGEPCAACHVNPGGGGPRTLRGLLWAARGRPDEVPQLPGLLIAPNATDGLEIYDTACAGCHGYSGEGLFAINLAQRGISKAAARSFIRRGIPDLGMPAFEGQLTPEQLEALASFVAELGQGAPLPDEYPLPPPEFRCEPAAPAICRGE